MFASIALLAVLWRVLIAQSPRVPATESMASKCRLCGHDVMFRQASLSNMIRDRVFLDFFESYTTISLVRCAVAARL